MGYTLDEAPPRKRGGFCCDGAQGKKGGLRYMALGTFKWFDVESGYDLISPDDGRRTLFVRSTDMASSSLL